MKVYVDLVIILNLFIDFLILLTVSYLLKRNVKIINILLGSFLGSISIVFLFINVSNLQLFLLKVIISFFMIIIAFGYKNFRYFINNFIYLYLTSIVLGGGLYLIKDNISLSSNGFFFIDSNLELNLIIVIFLVPLLLFFYLKQVRTLKYNYSNYYKVDLYYDGQKIKFNAFLDTGNKLRDPYKNRPIILIHTDKINFSYENSLLIPYKTVNGEGILKCLVFEKLIVDNKITINNVLVGYSKDDFGIEGIDMILNSETL